MPGFVPPDSVPNRRPGGFCLRLLVSAFLSLIEVIEDLERDRRKGEPPVGGVVVPVVTVTSIHMAMASDRHHVAVIPRPIIRH